VFYNNMGHNESTWSEPAFRQSLVAAIDWLAGVRPAPECLDAGGPLPAGPVPPAPDRKQIGKPCPVPAMRETNATEDFRSVHGWDTQQLSGGLPGNFTWGAQTWVVDLSRSRSERADVTIDLDWPYPTDDYDLSVTTAWGYYGSDNAVGTPHEQVVLTDVPHCAILQVAGDNMRAPSMSGTTASITVAPRTTRPPR